MMIDLWLLYHSNRDCSIRELLFSLLIALSVPSLHPLSLQAVQITFATWRSCHKCFGINWPRVFSNLFFFILDKYFCPHFFSSFLIKNLIFLPPFCPSFLVWDRLNEKVLYRSFHQLFLTGFGGVTSFSEIPEHTAFVELAAECKAVFELSLQYLTFDLYS